MRLLPRCTRATQIPDCPRRAPFARRSFRRRWPRREICQRPPRLLSLPRRSIRRVRLANEAPGADRATHDVHARLISNRKGRNNEGALNNHIGTGNLAFGLRGRLRTKHCWCKTPRVTTLSPATSTVRSDAPISCCIRTTSLPLSNGARWLRAKTPRRPRLTIRPFGAIRTPRLR
jgi:hypothetical protein